MPQALPDLPGLDAGLGLRQCGGRIALYQSLLRLYVQHNADFGAQVRAALERGDPAAARRLAHTLKGSSAQIGAMAIEEQAAGLESALRGQAVAEDTAVLLSQLESALATLLAGLAPHLAPD
jgi:two-component system sensor histidine kinase/response regulator